MARIMMNEGSMVPNAGIVLEVVEKQRYGEDDEKRRKYGSQCSDYAPSYSP